MGTFLGFLLGIAILMFLYSIIWNWVVIVPATLLLMLLRLDRFKLSTLFLNLLGYYVITSMLVLYTVGFVDTFDVSDSYILYTIVAGIIFFFGSMQGIGGKSAEARNNNDYHAQEILPYTLVAFFIGIVYYIFAVIEPVITYNGLTVTLLEWMYALKNVPVLSWIINIVGVIFVLNMLFMGVVGLLALIGGIANKVTRNESY
ncbi:hypothetical protein EKG37_18095 [Robertmurraya yapensis]|uniref:Uncharacterized protein n=1 Tax=Bacillus yapensis TaxID=2492960 RepID=A0A3S0L5Y7_9BACI|nr:hypothetical protein [Bacillus yapensis]RTR27806.1 hypothetical protein EKG37_18095 [Bacillus yapensis]TKS94209.1 hypothetical protein FAR12_18105 [Bacillus yapensis]